MKGGSSSISTPRASRSSMAQDGSSTQTSLTGTARNQLFLDELRHFLGCLRGEVQPVVGVRDAARSLRMALAARESIETGASWNWHDSRCRPRQHPRPRSGSRRFEEHPAQEPAHACGKAARRATRSNRHSHHDTSPARSYRPTMPISPRWHGNTAPTCRSYGPREFAHDLSPDLDVFRHALEWLRDREGYRCDLVVHLRPTAPVRRVPLIDDAIEAMLGHPHADSLRSVSQPQQTPYKMWRVVVDISSRSCRSLASRSPTAGLGRILPAAVLAERLRRHRAAARRAGARHDGGTPGPPLHRSRAGARARLSGEHPRSRGRAVGAATRRMARRSAERPCGTISCLKAVDPQSKGEVHGVRLIEPSG